MNDAAMSQEVGKLAKPGETSGEGLSLLRQKWLLRQCDEARLTDIRRRLSLSDCLARLLAGRGIGDDEMENFLSPKIKNYLPDPYIFTDMEKAVLRTHRAIDAGEAIVLYGDYDVDGATSAALLHGYLSAIGHANLRLYIPQRLSEGYGVNEAAVEQLFAEGHRLIITMDCGTSSHAALQKARAMGMDVIVLDHHKPQEALPEAFALINPNRPPGTQDEVVGRDYGHLAAVGVSFVFLVGLNRHLRTVGFFADAPNLAEPNLLESLDLVALGTVCDVVPLRGLNRAFVYQGLKFMNRRDRLGIRVLAEVSGLSEAVISAGDLGFRLGPRLNAGSRLGESSLAARLLTSGDVGEASALAWRLDKMNAERQELQAEQLSEAMVMVEQGGSGDVDRDYILVYGSSWHVGLVGILAARIKDRYKCPAIVVSFADGIGKGSGRSVAGVDLGSAIIEAHGLGLLESGGGHAQAVGLTISEDRLSAFDEFLADYMSRVSMDGNVLDIDLSLSLSAVNGDLCRELDLLEPYGSGHAVPLSLFSGVRVMDLRILKDSHISCRLCDSSGSVRGILFNGVEHVLGSVLLSASGGDEFDVVGRISPPYGDNAKGSIIIEDVFVRFAPSPL